MTTIRLAVENLARYNVLIVQAFTVTLEICGGNLVGKSFSKKAINDISRSRLSGVIGRWGKVVLRKDFSRSGEGRGRLGDRSSECPSLLDQIAQFNEPGV